MSAPTPQQFLSDLPVFAEFEDVADLSRYNALPEGWVLALADVVSSGQAIADGKYKMVNMAGASVITAVLNAIGQKDYPFVFGGDGAAIAVPPGAVEAARVALAAVARWILEDLGLQMRTALAPIDAIRKAGHDVRIARYRASADVSFTMFAGGGSAWAEAQMKQGAFGVEMAAPGSKPDLTGLSCRWNPIQARNGNIVSIIAVAGKNGMTAAFRGLVADVVAIANEVDTKGNPFPAEGPTPSFYLGGMETEARALAPPGKRFMAKLNIIFAVIMTVLLYRTNLTLGGFNARSYGRELARNTDFRKFDDGLKMTVDINTDQLTKIEACLEEARKKGICKFGLHRQASALVTCIVPSILTSDHMHFIDGAAGGYAQAASKMKASG
jgi:hypothetical protein